MDVIPEPLLALVWVAMVACTLALGMPIFLGHVEV
jgi:hypothetical protein